MPGGHDERLPLTLDELLHGRQQRDGTRLDEGTGLSKPAVLAGLRAGIEHGLIAAWTDRSGRGAGSRSATVFEVDRRRHID